MDTGEMRVNKMDFVLIVEDEPLEAIALEGNVKRIYGDTFEIRRAEDGLEALEICAKKAPDIALIDINIPGISGLELIQKLMEKDFSGKILIITAYDTSDYIRQALSLGVIDYLLKPVHTKELQEAMEKCIALLRKEKEQQEREISRTVVSSYAEQYLVQDILEARFPKETLKNAYQWPDDGKLSVSVVGFCGEEGKNAEAYLKIFLDKDKPFQKYFHVVSSVVDGTILLFLQSRFTGTRQKLLVMQQVCVQAMWRQIEGRTMIAGGVTATYEELCEDAHQVLENVKKAGRGLQIKQSAADEIAQGADRVKLCKKWEQRLREGQPESFARMFRRKVCDSGQLWGYVSLLFHSFFGFDDTVDLMEIFEIFEREKPYAQFERWLEAYYGKKRGCEEKAVDEKGMIQFAVEWMGEHFAEDISRFTVSEKLGLTETYFSHLFKQETGKSFVQALTELRVQQARKMLDAGITDLDEIAESCGYHNKKYFLEVFKRFTGYRITDYQREKLK